MDEATPNQHPTSAQFDLAAVRTVRDLEDRMRRLRIKAGSPTPGTIAQRSGLRYRVPKTTAARWIADWDGKVPRTAAVLGMVRAYGIPEHELVEWQEAYGRAVSVRDDSGQSAVPPTPETPAKRNPLLIGAALVTLVLVAGLLWSAFSSDGRSPAPTDTSAPIDPDQLTLTQPAQTLDVLLGSAGWTIPQRPFDLDNLKDQIDDESRWDFAVECRAKKGDSMLEGCEDEGTRVYHLLPLVAVGTSVAVVPDAHAADPAPCLGAVYGRKWVLFEVGQLYCVRTADRLGLIRPLKLPASAPRDATVIRVEFSGWSL